jgi:hypothetical protein
MLRTPAFLGFSMVSRNNRRRLVAITYAILLVLMATLIIVSRLGGRPHGYPLAVAWWGLLLVHGLVSRTIFGRLAKETALPEPQGGELTSLSLTPQRRPRADHLDERELAVRNAAYYEAYRALAFYSVLAWVALAAITESTASGVILVVQIIFMPVLAMAVTLPQAVVLWTEPDVPEEARA